VGFRCGTSIAEASGMRLALLAVLLATPAIASAAPPSVGAEVAVGASEIAVHGLPGVQPRLVFRLDGDKSVSVFARAGYTLAEDGYAFDAALGPDGRTCNASGWCAGLRLAVGLHHAAFTDTTFGSGEEHQVTSSFVEIMPYVSYDRFRLGVEAAQHKVQSGALSSEKEWFGRLGVTAAFTF
jgi:hypothetical protein